MLFRHGEHLYADNLAYIERLEKEIERQGVLLAGLKDCCKNDTALVGLIRDGVHHQLAAVSSNILEHYSISRSDPGQGTPSTSRCKY